MISMKKQLNVTDLSGEKVMIDFETGKYYMVKGTGNDGSRNSGQADNRI